MIRHLLHVPSSDWDARNIRAALRGHSRPDAVRRLEDAASEALGLEVIAFGSGRAALAALLLIADHRARRVILPGYTCVAVPNAIETSGRPAIFVDIEDVNLDLRAVVSASQPGDAVIVQHTYGIPVPASEIRSLRQRGLFTIEDRAHRFDGTEPEGDAIFFSLEHSKVVSGGNGGLAWMADPDLRHQLKALRDSRPVASDAEVRRILWTSALQVGLEAALGRLEPVSSIVRRVALRVPAVSAESQRPDELAGGSVALLGMHPALAELALGAIRRLRANLTHRRTISALYTRQLGSLVPDWAKVDLPLVRQPILVDDADAVAARVRAEGFDLGRRWFEAPVHPRGSRSGLLPWQAPRGLALSARVLSLPTHPRIDPGEAVVLSKAILRAAASRTHGS